MVGGRRGSKKELVSCMVFGAIFALVLGGLPSTAVARDFSGSDEASIVSTEVEPNDMLPADVDETGGMDENVGLFGQGDEDPDLEERESLYDVWPTVINPVLTWTGAPLYPRLKLVDSGGKELVEGVHYKVNYYDEDFHLVDDPIDPGTYYAKAVGIGTDYYGEAYEVEFAIKPVSVVLGENEPIQVTIERGNSTSSNDGRSWYGKFTAHETGDYIIAADGVLDEIFIYQYGDDEYSNTTSSSNSGFDYLGRRRKYGECSLEAGETTYIKINNRVIDDDVSFKLYVVNSECYDFSDPYRGFWTSYGVKAVQTVPPTKPEFNLKLEDGTKLTEGEDYTLRYYSTDGMPLESAPVEPGTYRVSFVGMSGSRYYGESSNDYEYEIIPSSGMWGTCPWEISADGTLTVHPGTGIDTEWASPWKTYIRLGAVRHIRFVEEKGKKVVAPANLSLLFATDTGDSDGSQYIESIDLSGIDTSSVTNMNYLFSGCAALASVEGLENLDTSSVTSMAITFFGCSRLRHLDLSKWDVSNVRVMTGIFAYCTTLESLDISSWDTSHVSDKGGKYGLLDGCRSLSSITVGTKFSIGSKRMFPEATAENGKWWSTKDRKWYTRDEIVSKRSGIADTYTSVETAPEFPDVKAGSWYEKVVYRAASLDLVAGYEDGSFGPDNNITRGQVAVILWRMAGLPSAGSSAKSFPDVKSSAYYAKAVAWASSVGVVNGYADGRFGPNDKVTREQLAVMLANYARKVGKKAVAGSASDYASMKDAGKVAPYAQPAVGWCFRNKILSGSNGNVLPKGNATRAQAAKMLVGVYDLVGE